MRSIESVNQEYTKLCAELGQLRFKMELLRRQEETLLKHLTVLNDMIPALKQPEQQNEEVSGS